jgi:hypothetical protein
MDFSWSEEELNFRDEIIEFAKSELNDDIITRDKEGKSLSSQKAN